MKTAIVGYAQGIPTQVAIEIARRAGRRLIIAGPVQDRDYFTDRVQPHLDDDRVRYLGSVGAEQRSEILGSAAAAAFT